MTVALLLISISHDGRPGKICGHNTLNCQFESHFYPQDVSRQAGAAGAGSTTTEVHMRFLIFHSA